MAAPARSALLLCLLAAAARGSAFQRPSLYGDDCVETEAVAAQTDGLELFPFELVDDGMSTQRELTAADTVAVTTAAGFTIEYHPTYKLVNNSLMGEVYVLYQCGAPAPVPDSFPADAKFFQVPLTSVAVPDTTPYAFLEALGVADRVHSVSPFVTEACGQALLGCNRTTDALLDYSNGTLVNAALGAEVDAVFTFFGSPSRLVVSLPATLDPGPLNRAEYIKLAAAFFNREGLANAAFNATRAAYEALAEAAGAHARAPVVAWVSHYVWLDDESFQVSLDEYKTALVADAGGANLDMDALLALPGVAPSAFAPTDLVFGWGTNDSFASKEEALEAFHSVLERVDVVIDETYTPDPAAYDMASFLAEFGINGTDADRFPFLSNATVFRKDGLISATGGMDWFEGAVLAADRVLADVVRAVHPEDAEDPGAFTWIRNIAAGEQPTVITAGACNTVPASCAIEAEVICPFVSSCGDGSFVQLLSDAGGSCLYAACTA